MKRLLISLFALVLVAACGPSATPSPDSPVDSDTQPAGLPPIYAPRPGDDALLRAEAYIDSVELLAMESFPVQYSITLKGNLPTPCHQLRVLYNEPDAQNNIKLEVYSVAEPDAVCVMMVQPFEQSIYLGSFSAGHYTVWVNGKMVADFDA